MKLIYVVTSNTGTALSRVIKQATSVPYVHASISLDDSLSCMYSFGRKHPRNPFFGGLVQEAINEGLYALKPNTVARIYELPVEEYQFERIESILEEMWSRREEYKYDVAALPLMQFNRYVDESENHHVCSTFVASVLQYADIRFIDKHIKLVQPGDFYELERLEGCRVHYEGLLKEYTPSKE